MMSFLKTTGFHRPANRPPSAIKPPNGAHMRAPEAGGAEGPPRALSRGMGTDFHRPTNRPPSPIEPPNGVQMRAREAGGAGQLGPRERRAGAWGRAPVTKDPPQRDDKPNSVPDSPPEGGSPGDDHSSSPAITGGIKQPTRRLRTGRPMTPPYLVLLRAGFSLPFTLRQTRCALTAPFHPYSPSP